MPTLYKIEDGKIKSKEVNLNIFMEYTSASKIKKELLINDIFKNNFAMNSSDNSKSGSQLTLETNNKSCTKKALLTSSAVKELKKLVYKAGDKENGKFLHLNLDIHEKLS